MTKRLLHLFSGAAGVLALGTMRVRLTREDLRHAASEPR